MVTSFHVEKPQGRTEDVNLIIFLIFLASLFSYPKAIQILAIVIWEANLREFIYWLILPLEILCSDFS